jgi:hypothetical protein
VSTSCTGGGFQPAKPLGESRKTRTLNPFRGSEARNIGCYLDPMRTRFDALTILFGLLILVAVTAGVMA